MKVIKLNQNKETVIDDEDFEIVSKYHWIYFSQGYVGRWIKQKGKQKLILLHRFISNTPPGMICDHINRNPLDNRKENLRSVTWIQNGINRIPKTSNASKYKGVGKVTKRKGWTAGIKVNGRFFGLGYFKTQEEAAIAYNIVAQKNHGEYAFINTIEGEQEWITELKQKVLLQLKNTLRLQSIL